MAYSLAAHYAGQALISGFDFVDFADPTQGFIAYQDYNNAVAQGLVSVNSATNAVTLKVDTTNTYNPDGSQGGRPSVRIESKVAVNQGLVIGDFAHMPGSTCGAWPSFWMYGPDWPNNGEIDIIEGENQAIRNLISGHTGPNCNLPTPASYTGSQQLINCTSPNDANGYDGCNYLPPTSDMSSYGDAFNAVGGGVYALDWTEETISIWHFARNGIPQDIVNKAPDPSTWGTPQAVFGGGSGIYSCDVSSSFHNMSIVLNIDLCGQYAGTLWGVNNQCKNYTATCEEWVGNNPSQLTNLYWEVNYIDVYSARSAAANTTQTSSTSTISRLPTIPYPTGSNSSITRTSTVAGTPAPLPILTSARPSQSGAPAASGQVPGTPSLTTPVVPSASPVDSIVPFHDPAAIGTFALLGCFSSSTGFSTFFESQFSQQMTPELCVGLCAGRRFAGVYDTSCYCADALDAGTAALADRNSCDVPCPGNADEFCGGLAAGTAAAALVKMSRRQQSLADILLTVYGNTAAEAAVAAQPQPAPGQGAASPAEYSAVFEQTIVSTVTYTAVCSTDAAKLVTSEYCTTITVSSCPWTSRNRPTKEAVSHSAAVPVTKAAASEGESTAPATEAATEAASRPTTTAVAMTAVTQSCNKCGAQGESTVTLTQPVAVVVALTKLVNVSVPAETGAQGAAAATAAQMPVLVNDAPGSGGLSAVLAVGMALAGALLLLG